MSFAHYQSNTKRFIDAAKQAELTILEQLSGNCVLVAHVCDLIHELQKERGVSNIYIASRGIHFSLRRPLQIEQTQKTQDLLVNLLDELFVEKQYSQHSHRFLNKIALALQGIGSLSELRMRVEKHKMSALASTQAYCRLIDSLLEIIFEAADVSSDPSIMSELIALFNFIQGKEFAGQERAWGAIGFAETHFTKTLCHRLTQLQTAQNNSFAVFTDYAQLGDIKKWEELQTSEEYQELSQLREMIKKLEDGAPIASEISEVWYHVCTKRIDKIHLIEQTLCHNLLDKAKKLIKQAKVRLNEHRQMSEFYEKTGTPYTLLFDKSLPGLIGSESKADSIDYEKTLKPAQIDPLSSHNSLYELLKSQSQKIDQINEELAVARNQLAEQKLVNRAKLMVMQQLNLTEDQAHQRLRSTAMKKRIHIAEVAEHVLKVSSPVE